MKENDQKKMLLSILGVAILVVAVIGISFAAYTATFDTGENSVSTGTIMVSYTEPTNAIDVSDAMPMDDADGIAQTGSGKSFDFTVSTQATSDLTVPYEISLTKVAVTSGTALADNEVKVYLTKGGTAVVNPTLVSALSASTVRSGSKLLYSTQDVFTSANTAVKTTNYVLKMWIAKNVTVDASTSKEYRAKVNVDSSVTPVS